MKSTFAIAALLGLATESTNAVVITRRNVPGVTFIQQADSDSSDDEESNVQLAGDYFVPGFSGAIGASAYARTTPERFAADEDDIFMRSMIQ